VYYVVVGDGAYSIQTYMFSSGEGCFLNISYVLSKY